MFDISQYTDENHFYSSQKQVQSLFDKNGRKSKFIGVSKEEFIIWQNEKRELFKQILGFDTFEPCEPEIIEIENVKCEGYSRIKYILKTEEFVYVPFFLLLPDKKQNKYKAVIAPHGHFTGMKDSVAGVRDNRYVASDIDAYDCNYGEILCRNYNYAVFCPDARGFGERAELAAQGEGNWKCTCTQLNRMAIPLGRCAIGMSVYDLVKLCDYICSRSDMDSENIGCTGLSGGGLQTLFLSAVDTRIKCAASSGYFYGAKEALLEQNGNCDCNYVPDLWLNFDMCDIAMLIAPRAFMVESGVKDELNGKSGIENVYSQVSITKKAYELYGKGENLGHAVYDMAHKWCGADIYKFFIKNL